MGALPPTEVMACHEIMNGLAHPNSTVYMLALNCIQKGVTDSQAAMVLARRPGLLKLLIAGISTLNRAKLIIAANLKPQSHCLH